MDESIQNQYLHLRAAAALDNTVIIFTGDNGILRGEHGLRDKRVFYDEAIRVPLIVWDGRQATHSTSRAIVLNADIAPTIARMSGAIAPANLDGKNLAPLMTSATASVRPDFLIHHWKVDARLQSFVEEWAVRNMDWVYAARTDGSVFLFDLVNDPFELNNLAANPAWATVRDMMAARMEQLKPSDRFAPIATLVRATPAPAAADGSRAIRFSATVTDRGYGNSEIRTPELIFSPTAGPGTGIPLDAADGRFDSATEVTFLDMPWSEYFAAGSPDTVYLRFRDVPGNWSVPVPLSLSLNASLRLNSASDTGANSADRVTVDNRPRFSGADSRPGATITLFATLLSPRESSAILLGRATADSSGRWQISSVPFAASGKYLITGEARYVDGQGQFTTEFLRPISFHLLALRQADGSVVANGSESSERIRISGNVGSRLEFWLNDISAGTLPGATLVMIHGNGGNDRIQMDGNARADLDGDSGNDTLVGGSGTNVLSGGPGSNSLSGGPGNDTYIFDDVGAAAEQITDLIYESRNEGFDSLSFVTPFGIVSNLNPDLAQPFVTLKSPCRAQRMIKFGITHSVSDFERLDGSNVHDTIRVGQRMVVEGHAGNDHIRVTQPLVPGGTLVMRQLTSGLNLASSAGIVADIQASAGTVRLNTTLPTGVSVTRFSTQSIRLRGPLVSVNSFLLSGGVKLTAAAGFTGAISVSLRSASALVPTTSEVDTLAIDVTYRPAIVTGGAVIWTEGGPPVILAPLGTVSDQDANFNGAVLRVSSSAIIDSSDRLIIVPRTQATGAVTLQNSLVLFNGVPVGTWSYVKSTQNLLVTFNADVTIAGLRAILRRVAFENSSQDPVGGNRTIRFQLTDGAGLGSAIASTTVLVQPVNNGPSGIQLRNAVRTLAENTITTTALKIADIVVQDDSQGTNTLSQSGADADAFQITGKILSLKPGTRVNARTKPVYRVRITAKDGTTGDRTGVSADFILNIATTLPVLTGPLIGTIATS